MLRSGQGCTCVCSDALVHVCPRRWVVARVFRGWRARWAARDGGWRPYVCGCFLWLQAVQPRMACQLTGPASACVACVMADSIAWAPVLPMVAVQRGQPRVLGRRHHGPQEPAQGQAEGAHPGQGAGAAPGRLGMRWHEYRGAAGCAVGAQPCGYCRVHASVRLHALCHQRIKCGWHIVIFLSTDRLSKHDGNHKRNDCKSKQNLNLFNSRARPYV